MKKLTHYFFLAVFVILSANAKAQPVLQNDYTYTLEIPDVTAMESSAAHLYILSDAEGMAVFRSRKDSLQWLYTAGGMQQRGHNINADIRFAYLFGDSQRLTVLEPTSVMGAYSATTLPAQPLDAQRYKNQLYLALGPEGLGILNLETPETLDSEVQIIESSALQNANIIQVAATFENLVALAENRTLYWFNKNQDNISFERQVSLSESINRLFVINARLMGSNSNGQIFEIADDGTLSRLGSIGEPVKKIEAWNSWLIIKGNSNRLWTSHQFTEPSLWKGDGDAGNFITNSKGTLWISEYDRVSHIKEGTAQANRSISGRSGDSSLTKELEIEPISDKTIPYPNALLIPLKLQNNYPVQNVQFSLQTEAENANIRGQSLYWQPQSGDRGEYQFKVVASTPSGKTASTSFSVNVQPFNSPPRFTPLRPISIPAGQPFTLPIRAIDPDGINKNLIRYLGINLPDGASINEQTGAFSWTPDSSQTGENSFRVIATDQYGAAASTSVTIRVIETNSANN